MPGPDRQPAAVDEFDVHYWELGNEPDVDPILVNSSSGFGCWGDIDDPDTARHNRELAINAR